MSELKNEFQSVKLPDMALADMYRQHLVIIQDGLLPAPKKREAAVPIATVSPTPPQPQPAAATQASAPLPAPPPQTLVEPTAPLIGPPYAVLGNFSRQVLVVLNDNQAVHCQEEALTFLTKIISAVGLSMDHIAILNTSGKKVTYPELKAQLPAKVAIYFGVEPVSIGVPMRFPHFQVQPWDGCTFLYAPSLMELNGGSAQQVEMKKQLWMALKKIFG